MNRPPAISMLLFASSALLLLPPIRAFAQDVPPEPKGEVPSQANILVPPGISDFDIEIYAAHIYVWKEPHEGGHTDIIACEGNFSARMGQHRLSSQDAVIWFERRPWQDRQYYEMEIFLWQDAEIVQPAGTIETGPALLVTLRTFGQMIMNADAYSRTPYGESPLYREGLRARGLLVESPAADAAEASAPVQIALTMDKLTAIRLKPPKQVEFSADQLSHEQQGESSVFIAIGNVLVAQGSPSASGEYLELRADAAVLYLSADKVGEAMPGVVGEGKPDKKRAVGAPPEDLPAEKEPTLTGGDESVRETLRDWVRGAYLEGDVVLTRGQRMIRAAQLYYDFETDQALILDVVARAIEESRGLPIYVRADRVQQLSATEYKARGAQVTTSEFYTPHVSIGAGEVYLQDRTPKNERGEVIGVQAGTYKAYNTTLNLEGIPVAYWPVSAGDFSEDRMAFRSAKFGYASDFGATMETRWYLFNLLGLQKPPGYDATLKLDYFTDRGPATGIDVDYQRDDYYGLFRSYYVHDNGEDDLGDFRGGNPDHENRGRMLWRHRYYLPELETRFGTIKDWELSLEAAYISDDNFLESYERNEWENAKDQETAAYLLKRQNNWQFSTLLNYRINEFLTQTEHLPDAQFTVVGEPLGDVANFYHESHAGAVRYRPDDRRFFNGESRWWDNTGETGTVLRGDTREELDFPLPDFGPLKLTPYVAARGTAWDDNPQGHSGDGRIFGSYGLRGNTYLTRVYDDVESEMFDLHRMRHVIKTDFTAWNAHSNQQPDELTPFDGGIEDIDDFGGATVGVRQRWQTKRGPNSKQRTVDWMTLDLEAGVFTDRQHGERTHGDFIYSRPEDSISSNFVAANYQYRLSDSTMLVYDGVYDIDRGHMGTSNVSVAVERQPRLAYFVGWRYIHDTDNSLLGFGANYKLSEKHTVGFREYYDLDEGRNYSTEIVYIRRWPRWYTAVTFDVDRTLEDIGINFSIWPEGAPSLALGSKRYTGLSESVGIRPR